MPPPLTYTYRVPRAASAHTLIRPDAAGMRTAGEHVVPYLALSERSEHAQYRRKVSCSGGGGRYAKCVYCLLNDTDATEDDAVFKKNFSYEI